MIVGSGNGRLGNHMFRNFAAWCVAKRQKIPVTFSNSAFLELGIVLDCPTGASEEPSVASPKSLTEDEAIQYAQYEYLAQCVSIDSIYCQNPYFCHQFYREVQRQRKSICDANPFRDRYKTTNDAFIHIRLDDATQWNPGYEYYTRALTSARKQRPHSNVYISSDSPHHPLVQRLLKETSGVFFQDTEIRTWQFASTCPSIVLSHGTFSWMIGVLAFDSTVIYPARTSIWHGTIYECMPWIAV
jgi:hypothetical protein